MNFDNCEQLKNFLKKESIRLGISIANTYNTYFARDLLEKINRISFNEIFVKGSFSEFAHVGKLVRPITDIDLVCSTSIEGPLQTLYRAMYDANNLRGISYELTRYPYQTKTGIYKINIIATYGTIKHQMSIDFQDNNKCMYQRDYKVMMPIFTGDNYFGVCVPTIEEYIAEKLCIILENQKENVLNTRLKDFYDIWKLLECDYIANDVEDNFCKMIVDRNKIDTTNLSADFLNKEYIKRHNELWDIIKDKYEFLDNNVKFEPTVYVARKFLNHQIEHFQRVRKL